jgi:hypothetical protein
MTTNATSYSDIDTYLTCPKKYSFRAIEGLQRKKRAVALFDGINAHEWLRVFFTVLQQGWSKDHAWNAVLGAVNKAYEENKNIRFEDEDVEVRDRIEETLVWIEGYCNQYAEDWEILHVEEEFIIMLDTGEVISFTPDLVVRDRNDRVWIVDHKTTSATPTAGMPFGDTQALLYYSGVKALYPDVAGFIFNRIRKKVPVQPRLTKTGDKRVADLKRIDTTYGLLKNFLEENGLMDDEAHRVWLAQLRDESSRWFWTETVYVNDHVEASIIEDVSITLQHMALARATGQYQRHLHEDRGWGSCSRCPFQRLCHAQQVGWNTEDIIAEDYEPRDAKNPYEERA